MLAAEESSVKFSFPSLGHVSSTWVVWVLHHQHLSSTDSVDLIEGKANSKGAAAVFVEELLVLESNLLLLLLLLLL